MRNEYRGECYRCSAIVEPGDGHFERFGNGWRLQHAACAIKYRGIPDSDRQALKMRHLKTRAEATGKRAQRARKKLREIMQPTHKTEDF